MVYGNSEPNIQHAYCLFLNPYSMFNVRPKALFHDGIVIQYENALILLFQICKKKWPMGIDYEATESTWRLSPIGNGQ